MRSSLQVVLLVFLCHPLTSNSLAVKSPRSSSSGSGSGSGSGFGAPQTQKKTYHVDETATTTRLVHFLKSHKSDISQAQVGSNPTTHLRGLYATKNIGKDKMICRVPSDCALALSNPALHGEDAPTMAHVGANFLTMYWKNSQARQLWSPYLDTLPTDPGKDVTPDFFDDEEIALLEFPRLVDRVRQRKQDIVRVASEKDLTTHELRFATWIVSSRAFPIALSADETSNNEGDVLRDERGQVMTKVGNRKWIRLLVPFLDVANHHSEPNAMLTILDPEKDDA